MTSSGNIARCVVSSRQGVFSLRTTRPSASRWHDEGREC